MACVKDGVTLDAAETFFVPVFLLGNSTLGIENLKYVYKPLSLSGSLIIISLSQVFMNVTKRIM